MFDLKLALEEWKQAIGVNGECTQQDVEELESHLCEQMEELQAGGLSEEEAFLVSRSRMGDLAAVNAQYQQADPAPVWKSRFRWMAVGAFCWSLIKLLYTLLESLVVGGALAFGVRGYMLVGLSIAVTVAVFWLVYIGARRFMRYGWPQRWVDGYSRCTSTRLRCVLSVSGVVVLLLVARSVPSVFLIMRWLLPTEELASPLFYVASVKSIVNLLPLVLPLIVVVRGAGYARGSVRQRE